MKPVQSDSTPTVNKRRKVTGIKNCEGAWDPATSKFVRRPATPTASTPASNKPTAMRVDSVSSIESIEDKHSGLTTKSSDVEFLLKATESEIKPAGETCNLDLSEGSSDLILLHSAIDHVEAKQALSCSGDSIIAMAPDPIQEGSD